MSATLPNHRRQELHDIPNRTLRFRLAGVIFYMDYRNGSGKNSKESLADLEDFISTAGASGARDRGDKFSVLKAYIIEDNGQFGRAVTIKSSGVFHIFTPYVEYETCDYTVVSNSYGEQIDVKSVCSTRVIGVTEMVRLFYSTRDGPKFDEMSCIYYILKIEMDRRMAIKTQTGQFDSDSSEEREARQKFWKKVNALLMVYHKSVNGAVTTCPAWSPRGGGIAAAAATKRSMDVKMLVKTSVRALCDRMYGKVNDRNALTREEYVIVLENTTYFPLVNIMRLCKDFGTDIFSSSGGRARRQGTDRDTDMGDGTSANCDCGKRGKRKVEGGLHWSVVNAMTRLHARDFERLEQLLEREPWGVVVPENRRTFKFAEFTVQSIVRFMGNWVERYIRLRRRYRRQYRQQQQQGSGTGGGSLEPEDQPVWNLPEFTGSLDECGESAKFARNWSKAILKVAIVDHLRSSAKSHQQTFSRIPLLRKMLTSNHVPNVAHYDVADTERQQSDAALDPLSTHGSTVWGMDVQNVKIRDVSAVGKVVTRIGMIVKRGVADPSDEDRARCKVWMNGIVANLVEDRHVNVMINDAITELVTSGDMSSQDTSHQEDSDGSDSDGDDDDGSDMEFDDVDKGGEVRIISEDGSISRWLDACAGRLGIDDERLLREAKRVATEFHRQNVYLRDVIDNNDTIVNSLIHIRNNAVVFDDALRTEPVISASVDRAGGGRALRNGEVETQGPPSLSSSGRGAIDNGGDGGVYRARQEVDVIEYRDDDSDTSAAVGHRASGGESDSWRSETFRGRIDRHIEQLLGHPSDGDDNGAAGQARNGGIRLNAEQEHCVRSIFADRSHPVTMVSGLPGTGKTEVISLICRIAATVPSCNVLVTTFMARMKTSLKERIEGQMMADHRGMWSDEVLADNDDDGGQGGEQGGRPDPVRTGFPYMSRVGFMHIHRFISKYEAAKAFAKRKGEKAAKENDADETITGDGGDLDTGLSFANNGSVRDRVRRSVPGRYDVDQDTGDEFLTFADSLRVIIIDEAETVSAKLMASLMEIVSRSAAKLVLVGDSNQIRSIDTGDVFFDFIMAHMANEHTARNNCHHLVLNNRFVNGSQSAMYHNMMLVHDKSLSLHRDWKHGPDTDVEVHDVSSWEVFSRRVEDLYGRHRGDSVQFICPDNSTVAAVNNRIMLDRGLAGFRDRCMSDSFNLVDKWIGEEMVDSDNGMSLGDMLSAWDMLTYGLDPSELRMDGRNDVKLTIRNHVRKMFDTHHWTSERRSRRQATLGKMGKNRNGIMSLALNVAIAPHIFGPGVQIMFYANCRPETYEECVLFDKSHYAAMEQCGESDPVSMLMKGLFGNGRGRGNPRDTASLVFPVIGISSDAVCNGEVDTIAAVHHGVWFRNIRTKEQDGEVNGDMTEAYGVGDSGGATDGGQGQNVLSHDEVRAKMDSRSIVLVPITVYVLARTRRVIVTSSISSVRVPSKDIRLGYTCTVDKMMGSEADVVFSVFGPGGGIGWVDRSKIMVLTTRARRKLYVIGHRRRHVLKGRDLVRREVNRTTDVKRPGAIGCADSMNACLRNLAERLGDGRGGVVLDTIGQLQLMVMNGGYDRISNLKYTIYSDFIEKLFEEGNGGGDRDNGLVVADASHRPHYDSMDYWRPYMQSIFDSFKIRCRDDGPHREQRSGLWDHDQHLPPDPHGDGPVMQDVPDDFYDESPGQQQQHVSSADSNGQVSVGRRPRPRGFDDDDGDEHGRRVKRARTMHGGAASTSYDPQDSGNQGTTVSQVWDY